jgi:hypothetical protein
MHKIEQTDRVSGPTKPNCSVGFASLFKLKVTTPASERAEVSTALVGNMKMETGVKRTRKTNG